MCKPTSLYSTSPSLRSYIPGFYPPAHITWSPGTTQPGAALMPQIPLKVPGLLSLPPTFLPADITIKTPTHCFLFFPRLMTTWCFLVWPPMAWHIPPLGIMNNNHLSSSSHLSPDLLALLYLSFFLVLEIMTKLHILGLPLHNVFQFFVQTFLVASSNPELEWIL
jgi:hypothetical protein